MLLFGKFQSLVGFKINWNLNCFSVRGGNWMFQSLVGFKINWNGFTGMGSEGKGCFNP